MGEHPGAHPSHSFGSAPRRSTADPRSRRAAAERPQPPPSLRALKRIFGRRRRALRELGVVVPRHLAQGPPDTLPQRIATLDRWICLDLNLAGGKRLPAWDDDRLDEEGDSSFPAT